MELSKEAMNFGQFSWKVIVAEGKKAVKKGTKKQRETNFYHLKFILVRQTSDDLSVQIICSSSSVKMANYLVDCLYHIHIQNNSDFC